VQEQAEGRARAYNIKFGQNQLNCARHTQMSQRYCGTGEGGYSFWGAIRNVSPSSYFQRYSQRWGANI